MKKKILSLLLASIMIIGILAGCGSKSIPLADVTADPAAYIEAGIKKSLSASPIGSLLELEDTEAISAEFKFKPEGEDYLDLNATVAHKDLSVLAELKAKIEGQDVAGSFFIDKENFALKSELLTDILGTASVGIGLKDFAKNFKESSWYNMLVVQSGIEETLKNKDGETIDLQKVVDLAKDFIENIDAARKECVEYKVLESHVKINDKNVECFQITELVSDELETTLSNEIEKFCKELEKLLPEGASVGLDQELKEIFEHIDAKTETTYFISPKSGALIQVNHNTSLTVDDGSEEGNKQSVSVMINFGEKPETTFVPHVEIKAIEADDETIIIGKSAIDKSAKTFKFTVEAKTNSEEDDMVSATFTLDKDGNYKIESVMGEEKDELTGTFKVDGSKVNLTADIKDGEETVKVSINLDFNAKKPTGFEYEDLLKWDEEKIKSLLTKLQGGSVEPEDDEIPDIEIEIDQESSENVED